MSADAAAIPASAPNNLVVTVTSRLVDRVGLVDLSEYAACRLPDSRRVRTMLPMPRAPERGAHMFGRARGSSWVGCP